MHYVQREPRLDAMPKNAQFHLSLFAFNVANPMFIHIGIHIAIHIDIGIRTYVRTYIERLGVLFHMAFTQKFTLHPHDTSHEEIS
jgi:hypothetical protein